MRNFKVHTKETAQAKSAEQLAAVGKSLGFIPNLFGVLADSPATLNAYLTMGSIFDQSTFSPTERQVVILAASRVNECRYCMAAHTVVAGMQKVDANVIDALRTDKVIADKKLQALRTFTVAVVEKRGWVNDNDVAAFLAAGYNQGQVLEVILGISFKTISNYVNHIAGTPLDAAFAPKAWEPDARQAARAAS